MDFTFRQLEIFRAVVVSGSITKASHRIGLSQPSISQQLAKLEDSLGVQLVNRNRTGSVSLTPAGAKRLEGITTSLVGKPMMVTLDGKSLSAELIRKSVAGGVIEIPGRWSLDAAEALARRISGKDPLPDDLGM